MAPPPVGRIAALFVALCAVAAGAALGGEELESNDRMELADAFTQGETLVGECGLTVDFSTFYVINLHEVVLRYNFMDDYGQPAHNSLSLLTPNGAEFRRVADEGEGMVTFTAQGAGMHFAKVGCSGSATLWSLRYTTSYNSQGIAGADEYEPNDMGPIASTLTPGRPNGGQQGVTADPIDVWRVAGGGSGDQVITLTTTGTLVATLKTVGADGTPLVSTGSNITLRGLALADAYFAVGATSGDGGYTLNASAAPIPTSTHEGADETEPNDVRARASPVTASDTLEVSGLSHISDDPVDWYLLTFTYPTRARVTVESVPACSGDDCASLTLLLGNGTEVIDPFGVPVDGYDGYRFAARANSTYLARIDSGNPGGAYRLVILAAPYTVHEGDEFELVAANASGTIRGFATGSGAHPELESFNFIEGGDGNLYGRSLLLLLLNPAPVSITIEVRAGTMLTADEPDITRFMITRDAAVELAPWSLSETLVWASPTNPDARNGTELLLPGYGWILYIDGMATGSLALVANQTANGSYSGKAETLAVWSASGVPRSRMEEFGASSSDIAAATKLLNDAQVQTVLTAGASPTTPPPPTQNPTDSMVGPAAMATVAIMLLGLLAWGIMRSRKQPPLAPPTTAPGAPVPYMPPYAPGAPAYSPVGYPAPPMYPPPGTYAPPYYGYYAPPAPTYYTPYAPPAPERAAPAPASRACPKCGKSNAATSPYCVYCGEFFTK